MTNAFLLSLHEGGAKRRVEESAVEVSSRKVAKVTSPRASPLRTRAPLVEKEEEDGTGDRVPPPVHDAEMQKPARDEGPAEKAPTVRKFLAIKPRRGQAKSSTRARARLEEGQAGDDTSWGRLVATAQLTHDWVGVSSATCPLSPTRFPCVFFSNPCCL